MKVALVQYDILWADPEANRARIRELILAAPAADMYLMPEMLSTGFATSAEAVAESDPPATLELLKELADMRCAAMACSLRVRVADGSIRYLKPIDLTSARSCADCEQIVGPKPDECSAGRIVPVSAAKLAAAARSSVNMS